MDTRKKQIIHQANNIMNMMNGICYFISKEPSLSLKGNEQTIKLKELINDLHQLLTELSFID